MTKSWAGALGALLMTAGMAQPAIAGRLQAGAARVSITPPASEFPYSVPREKDFVGVHDDLYVRTLALDDGRGRALVVSIDVTTVPNPDGLLAAVAAASGVPAGRIMVLATHTHNVPLVFFHGEITNPAQTREMQRITAAAAAAGKEAVAALRPARIAWARGKAFVNTNNGEEAGRKGWYEADAASDKSLDVVRVTDLAGKPVAAMLTYASHAEVMFRSVSKDGGYEVTGDLPGATARLVEGQPDGAPVVLFAAGAEGDQLPLFKSLQPAARLPAADEGAAGWGLLDVQARRLASAALDTMATMPAGRDDVSIAMDEGAAVCPGQHYDVERPSGRILGVTDTAPVSIPLATLRLGDFAVAAVGADLASDLGLAIRKGSPVAHTTVVTMLAGAVGYVLNDGAFVTPGHGALGSPVKPGCAGPALTRDVARMLSRGAR